MTDKAKVITPAVIVQLLLFVVLVPFLPLLISRRWGWWEAWVYGLTWFLGFVVSRLLVARRNPDLIAERAKIMRQEDALSWDKLLAPLVAYGAGLIPLTVGLQAALDPSPPFGLLVKAVALAVSLAGYIVSTYALYENRYFSGMVRIQSERGHQVISSGPYRWIRHPGYFGALLFHLATPLFLDAPWAFLPAGLLAIALAVRTALEDRTLKEQLPGYRDYAGRVRYRLLPGIW